MPIAAVTDEPNPHSRWRGQLTGRGLPSPAGQGILAGARRGYLTELLAPAGTDRRAAAEALLPAVRGQRHEDLGPGSPPCVAMYLTTLDVRALRAAGVAGLPVALDTDAWIDMPAGGWDAWLDS